MSAAINQNVERNWLIWIYWPGVFDHWALNHTWVDLKWSILDLIEDTENWRLLSKSLTFHLDELVICISWTTLRERSKNIIETENKACFSVINAVESKINLNLVTTDPSRWRGTFHSVFINIVSWNELSWSIVLIKSRISISKSGWNLSESAFNSSESVSDVRELGTLQPDFSSSFNTSRSWLKINDDWLLIVAEGESSVLEINSIERNSNWWWCSSVRWSWSLADDPVWSDVLCSDSVVTNLAEWQDAILWLEIKPSSCELQVCSTWGKTTWWLNLLHNWLSVEVEFKVWAILIHNINVTSGWHAVWTSSFVMACDVYRNWLSNLNINWSSESLHIRRGIGVLSRDIWSHRSDILLKGLALFKMDIICFGI